MLAPVLASLALVCHGQLEPPTPVEQAMSYRRQFGMRHDRAFVRRLQRSEARRDDQGFAFTRREWRYWRKRSRIELSGTGPVRRYLARRPGLSGGISIEDDWPEGPFLQVRLTRDRAVHEAALRRRYRYPLRTVAVEFSEDHLRAVQDAIEPIEGFEIKGLWVDGDLNRVVVQGVSTRTDHQAAFRARYGPAVVSHAVPEDTRLECARLRGARPSSTGRSVRLRWWYSRGQRLETIEVTEHADRVEIGVVLRVPYFFNFADARPASGRVVLSRPLGDRRIVDAATGRAL